MNNLWKSCCAARGIATNSIAPIDLCPATSYQCFDTSEVAPAQWVATLPGNGIQKLSLACLSLGAVQSMKGKGFVLAAQDALSSPQPQERERLKVAAQMFWRAMFYEQTWPEPLRVHAADLVVALFAQGPIDRTIAAMDDNQVRQTLQRLGVFCAEFLRCSP